MKNRRKTSRCRCVKFTDLNVAQWLLLLRNSRGGNRPKVRNPPTPKLQKASGTLDFLFVMGWELAHKTIVGSVRGLQHTLSSDVIKCTAIRLSPRK